MINSINPQYTLMALQTKYGDVHGFTYAQPKPVFLQWTISSNSSTHPSADQVTARGDTTSYSVFVGTMTINILDNSQGSTNVLIYNPNVIASSSFGNGVINRFGNIGATVSANNLNVPQWKQDIVSNSIQYSGLTGSIILGFQFIGFYLQQGAFHTMALKKVHDANVANMKLELPTAKTPKKK